MLYRVTVRREWTTVVEAESPEDAEIEAIQETKFENPDDEEAISVEKI